MNQILFVSFIYFLCRFDKRAGRGRIEKVGFVDELIDDKSLFFLFIIFFSVSIFKLYSYKSTNQPTIQSARDKQTEMNSNCDAYSIFIYRNIVLQFIRLHLVLSEFLYINVNKIMRPNPHEPYILSYTSKRKTFLPVDVVNLSRW